MHQFPVDLVHGASEANVPRPSELSIHHSSSFNPWFERNKRHVLLKAVIIYWSCTRCQKFPNAETLIINAINAILAFAGIKNEVHMRRYYNVYFAGNTCLVGKKDIQFAWIAPMMSQQKNLKTWAPINMGSKKGCQTLASGKTTFFSVLHWFPPKHWYKRSKFFRTY